MAILLGKTYVVLDCGMKPEYPERVCKQNTRRLHPDAESKPLDLTVLTSAPPSFNLVVFFKCLAFCLLFN